MIIVFTGPGKGKTTTALGQGLRAMGQGKRVICYQFIKSKDYKTGEEETIKTFGDKFKLIKGGRGFVGILGDKLPRKVHEEAALSTLNEVQKAIASSKWDVVILDEVNVATSLKLINPSNVVKIIKQAPPEKIIILTGRGAPKIFIRHADLCTYFIEVKHPFKKGVKARKGVEY